MYLFSFHEKKKKNQLDMMWAPVLFLTFLFIYFFMDDFQFVVFFKVFNPDVLNNGTLAPKTLNTTEIIKIKKK